MQTCPDFKYFRKNFRTKKNGAKFGAKIHFENSSIRIEIQVATSRRTSQIPHIRSNRTRTYGERI